MVSVQAGHVDAGLVAHAGASWPASRPHTSDARLVANACLVASVQAARVGHVDARLVVLGLVGSVQAGRVGHVGRGPRGERWASWPASRPDASDAGLAVSAGALWPASRPDASDTPTRGSWCWASWPASRPDTPDVGLVVSAGPCGERPGKLDAGHIDAGLV